MNPERGARIRSLRRGRKLTQQAFASLFGVTRVTVNRWEKGVPPRVEHYNRLEELGLQHAPDAPSTQRAGETEQVSTFGGYSSRQLTLPFDQTFMVELKIGPQRAGTVDVRIQVIELTS